jgi:hypothetical protein
MSDPDPRPKPQYGEYATPEEQRAAIKVPAEHLRHLLDGEPAARADATPPDSSVPAPVSGSDRDGVASDRTGQRPQAHDGHGARAAQPTIARNPAARSIDRVATYGLLAVGLLNVLTTLPGLFDLGNAINATFQQFGIGAYHAGPLTTVLGIVLVVVYAGGWLATAALSVWSLRRGRITFWIPLVAGIVVMIVSMVCFAVLFFGDQSFLDYVTTSAL